ncbi:LysR family transcriptional regulator [Paucibacter soli]|uniref:LysR family transcriptional regulator n=1 Tax=Paucibacter soli TaxID=3133433 RepID=UPI0030A0D24F
MISHRHIEVFRAVMHAGSVTEAARALHSSQPTISRELARLEQLLGYALFERQRGRLKATARALQLFDEVQRSFQGLERVIGRAHELGRAEQERLNILCLPALAHALLPAVSENFLARHPAAQLSITPQESPLLEEWMSAQRFDLGLSEQRQATAGTRLERLASLDEVCVLPAGHALLAKPVLSPADFEGERFVSLAAEDPYRVELDRIFAEAGVQRRLQLETHSAVAVCAMVEAGLGLAIVNPLTALACAGERLQWRRFAVSLPFELNALLPEHRPVQALTADYLALVKRELSGIAKRLAAG